MGQGGCLTPFHIFNTLPKPSPSLSVSLPLSHIPFENPFVIVKMHDHKIKILKIKKKKTLHIKN
jgi:hypothetical protein